MQHVWYLCLGMVIGVAKPPTEAPTNWKAQLAYLGTGENDEENSPSDTE